jgi:hypothetical protein
VAGGKKDKKARGDRAAKPGAAKDLPAPAPASKPTKASDAEFVENISGDLAVDAAESLRMIVPPQDTADPASGIPLADLGLPVQMKGTTQKMDIRELLGTKDLDDESDQPVDEYDEDTLTDLPPEEDEDSTEDGEDDD